MAKSAIRRRPHCGDWEPEEGEHLRRTTATIHARVCNLPPEEFQEMSRHGKWTKFDPNVHNIHQISKGKLEDVAM